MPSIKKRVVPTSWDVEIIAAAGTGSRDFFALGTSSEYDDQFEHLNPSTVYSPSCGYTHVLHFKDLAKHQVFRVTDELEDIWWSPAGRAWAAGFPKGIFEIDATGVRDYGIEGIPGTFTGIWGTSEKHLFACGATDPFLFYRRSGTWQSIALPENTPRELYKLSGFNEQDVYVVGDNGTVLHFDGRVCRRLEVPTTRRLLSVAMLDEQYLCVGGFSGVLLFGNRHGWRAVPSGTTEPLHSLASFNGNVCFATPDGVWAFDGRQQPRLLVDRPGRWLFGLGDGLVIVDVYESWLFDGSALHRLDTRI